MRIVICDDTLKDLIKLEKLLLKYSSYYPDMNFEIEKYSDAALLSKKIQEEDLADIYILDIVMSKITGIDIGRQIRKNNKKSVIIYVTVSDNYALDAYGIYAIRYLLKPVNETLFFESLDYALSYIDIKESAVYLVKTKNGLSTIPYSKIEYIESASRKLEVHLTSGEIITSIFIRKSFDEEIKELMRDRSFIRVHKSFVIHLNYVKRLNRNDITMDSGVNIPISRKSALEVKNKYLLFVSEQYR